MARSFVRLAIHQRVPGPVCQQMWSISCHPLRISFPWFEIMESSPIVWFLELCVARNVCIMKTAVFWYPLSQKQCPNSRKCQQNPWFCRYIWPKTAKFTKSVKKRVFPKAAYWGSHREHPLEASKVCTSPYQKLAKPPKVGQTSKKSIFWQKWGGGGRFIRVPPLLNLPKTRFFGKNMTLDPFFDDS